MDFREILTEQDKLVYDKTGYGKSLEINGKFAFLVIDMTYEFTGFTPEPILNAIDTFSTSCGEYGWSSVGVIKRLLPLARAKKIPVIYTKTQRLSFANVRDPWLGKKDLTRWQHISPEIKKRGAEIVADIAPESDDFVLVKAAPSAFFGTPLIYAMQKMGVDTLIITGCTTSGCIRATVTDGFSYGFQNVVIADGVFDRFERSHIVNLFDMQAKFANVISSEEAESLLQTY